MTTRPTLTTLRLQMRPFHLSDTEQLHSVRRDREAMRYWDWPHDESLSQTTHVAFRIRDEMRARKAIYWIAKTSDGEFVGIFDLSELSKHSADLGFLVYRQMWGMGYGFEATAAILAEAWKHGLCFINARVHAENTRSFRLLTKLGFKEQGRMSCDVRPGVSVVCCHFNIHAPVSRHSPARRSPSPN